MSVSAKYYSIAKRLQQNVAYNLAAMLLLLVMILLGGILFQQQQQAAFLQMETKHKLNNLTQLVGSVGEKLSRLIFFGKEKDILEILTRSKDFQKAFDEYLNAITRSGSLTEQSLTREYEPVIVSIRMGVNHPREPL